jgi:hypothetical protein
MRNRWSVSLAACLVLAAGRAVRADEQAEMKALVARALKAAGGAKNLAKYPALTWKFKGKVFVQGNGTDYTAELSSHFPLQSKLTLSLTLNGQQVTVIRVLNKDKGWFKLNDTTIAMNKDQLAEEKDQVYVHWLLSLVPLKDRGVTLAPVGEVKVGDHDAVGIKVTRKGNRDVNLYFDKKTALLVKAETIIKVPETGKEVSQEWLFTGYKETDGVKYPAKARILRDGKDYVSVEETTEFKPEEKAEKSDFDKP